MRNVTLPNEVILPEVVRMLSEGNNVILKTKGNSMLPFVVGGRDSVVLQVKDRFAVGNIVLAEVAPKQFVLHRIVKIEESKITLMGDGNLSGTEECHNKNICGHAITIIRKGKHIDCSSNSERRKTLIWQKLLPVRRYLLAIYKRLYRL